MPIEREVRFAVVIYGGVSLAVYINGVVQEMLHLVRATALPKDQLKGSELIYRDLACRLGKVQPKEATDDPGSAMRLMAESTEPRTKFVVDILSGTSAGGINAIFLGKALSRGASLDNLADLWLEVADLDKLLNDRGAVEGPLRYEPPPKALLSGKWMYLKLIEALDAMEDNATGIPLVENLDVFSTTTDLDGLPVPLLLADKDVEELRHKSVFHFRQRSDVTDDKVEEVVKGLLPDQPHRAPPQDFILANNPFLAFTARCTSSFPFAFEPMALCDVYPIIQGLPKHRGQRYAEDNSDFWKDFYPNHVRAETAYSDLTPFVFRAFGDGGYLDNKPFSYAIDTITTRYAEVPVDRKLIYIEPSPENIRLNKRKGPEDRPDAVENSLDALITLPRYETIREDLQRVLDWNREVARLKRVLSSLSTELDNTVPDPLRERAWLRLRLSAVTDTMSMRVTEALGLDPCSRFAEALRVIIGVWRDKHEPEENDILKYFDFDFYLRAIQYLRGRLDQRVARGERDVDYKRLSAAKSYLRHCLEDPLMGFEAGAKENPGLRDDLKLLSRAGLSSATRNRVAEKLLAGRWNQDIDDAYQGLKQYFGQWIEKLNRIVEELLAENGGRARFVTRDTIVYPIHFGTSVGEFSEIDVIRISPADATPIEGVTDGAGGRKLKGEKFGAFGAFLEEDWRRHDMLRGRLDGAERLITAILSDLPEEEAAEFVTARETLIKQAQEAIAADWELFDART